MSKPNMKTEFARFQHDYIFENIQAADQKAAVILAVASGLLGYVTSNVAYIGWLRVGPFTLQGSVSALATLALIACAFFALRVVWPNLVGSPHGLVFWQSVAGFPSAAKFANFADSKSDEEIAEEILRHNYEVAKVCRTKYRRLRCALWAGLLGACSLFGDFAIVTNASLATSPKPAVGQQHVAVKVEGTKPDLKKGLVGKTP